MTDDIWFILRTVYNKVNLNIHAWNCSKTSNYNEWSELKLKLKIILEDLNSKDIPYEESEDPEQH